VSVEFRRLLSREAVVHTGRVVTELQADVFIGKACLHFAVEF